MNVLTIWLLVLVCLGQMRENLCDRCVDGSHSVYYGIDWFLDLFMNINYRDGLFVHPQLAEIWLMYQFSERGDFFLKYQDVYYGITYDNAFSWRYSPSSDLVWKKYLTGSDLSTSCLKGCVRNYSRIFGKYNTTTNNSHHFGNVLRNVLCTTRICPDWCMDKNEGKDQCYEQTNNWWICNIRVCLFITDLQLYVKHSLHCCWIKTECLYLYFLHYSFRYTCNFHACANN